MKASETGALWLAVRDRDTDDAVEALRNHGWSIASAALNGDGLMTIRMSRGPRQAALYARGGRIGMVDISNTAAQHAPAAATKVLGAVQPGEAADPMETARLLAETRVVEAVPIGLGSADTPTQTLKSV